MKPLALCLMLGMLSCAKPKACQPTGYSDNNSRVITGSAYTVFAGDYYRNLEFAGETGAQVTLPEAAYFHPEFHFEARAYAGSVTFTALNSAIDGKSQLVIRLGECRDIHLVKDHYEAYPCPRELK